MEEIKQEPQENPTEKATAWFQENLRVIVSVAIVVIIAGGIYSYSKRTDSPVATKEESSISEEGTIEVDGDKSSTEEAISTETKKEEVKAPESKETEGSFVESAAKGEGSTHLARRALANYLEKNPDSSLTKEHKIYIEDYLRKNSGYKGRVSAGTTIEFSKELIKNSIEKSKTLNERQLQNLKKYSARVSSL